MQKLLNIPPTVSTVSVGVGVKVWDTELVAVEVISVVELKISGWVGITVAAQWKWNKSHLTKCTICR